MTKNKYFIHEKETAEILKAMRRISDGDYSVRLDSISPLSAEFNAMALKLESDRNEQSALISNTVHDLKSPITAAAGFIDGILDGTIPEEKRDHCLKIVSIELKRMSRLASCLSELSKIESGIRKFNFAPFDVAESARTVLISLEQRINEKKLDVEFITESDKAYASADPDAIHEVIYNIVDNAIKFSKECGLLSVSIKDGGEKLLISIYNEGEGIPPEDVAHVFDRFFRTEKSRDNDKTGSGLGMHIAKTVIDAHGESIYAESEYGQNCRFCFTLSKAYPRKEAFADAKAMVDQ